MMKLNIRTLLACAVLALAVSAASAQVQITKVDKIQPTDEVFMDMAVTAAKTSVGDQGLPCGAVVILNGAWRSAGMQTNEVTAEQAAINKSRLSKLANASIYTVVQPVAKACEAIAKSGADAVYFTIPAADAIAAGIYPADAYEGADKAGVKLVQIPFAEANDVVNQWKSAK